MDIKYVQSMVETLPGVSAWEIRRLRKKSHQRYLIFDQIESQRLVETEKFIVTLYKKYNCQRKMVLGESTVSSLGRRKCPGTSGSGLRDGRFGGQSHLPSA